MDLELPHTRIELQVSYRSTAEITVRASSSFRWRDDVPETTREGPPVELFQFASPGEA